MVGAGLRVRIFKAKAFARFARKADIDDAAIRKAVHGAERGIIDAELGGGVIKLRVARPGEGKSGGYRTMVLYKPRTRAFFVHGFAKSDQGNIQRDELEALKTLAKELLGYSDAMIAKAVANGTLIEVNDEENEAVP